MSPEQIAKTAERLRALGVPDCLNRWLRTDQPNPKGYPTMLAKVGPKEHALQELRDGHPKTEAPNGVVVGTTVVPAPKKALAKRPGKGRETGPAKKAPKAKKAAAAKRAPPAGRTNPAKGKDVRPGSKLETIVGLLRRPQGCTTADVLRATGWPAVSMPQQAKAAGVALKKEKTGKVTVYRAA